MEADVMWRALAWPGLEHLALRAGADGISADGLVIARLEDGPVRLAYRVECTPSWTTRRVQVSVAGGNIALECDEAGRWRDGSGTTRPDLDGCVDVDIALTPATNTLPIRRLGLAVGESREIAVVYFVDPDFRPRPAAQRYTRLEADLYRYESGDFAADLQVDDRGLVVRYPGLWERIP